ncbi:MAG: ABC transporter ATP-binding protein [Peptococcaceae bacterium]|nr:ABC transporter ATP-binding protein [Peptococcaceae bacterium]MDH7524608.1 ABC transporter ATP-binding protein [Peptococcaceae bacterium]
MENILEVKGLRKKYPGFTLNNVGFALKKGYIMGFIGPNGAGKTTTIKLIMNLINREGGEIKVFGLDNIRHEQQIKQRLGFVYDENYYYEELTPLEIKRIIAPFYRSWDDDAFSRYLREFELPPRKALKTFSRGMKMKMAIALALSHRAELLIMDEPASGLDPVFRSEFLDILQEFITDENKGILFSSHLTSDLDKIADYVCLIDEGEIVLDCSRIELQEQYAVVKGEKKYLDEEMKKRLIGLRLGDFGFSGLTREAVEIRRACKDSVLIERPTLEEIMLYMVRREKRCPA